MCREHVCCQTAVTVGLNKPKPPNQTGKENKLRSTVPGISHPSNLGMKAEPIRSSNGWNKQEERVQTRRK